MSNEKGLSIIEVVWSILIISSIISSIFLYQIKYSKKVKNNILENLLLIEYHQIVEKFKVEYISFDEFILNNSDSGIYKINKDYLKNDIYLHLSFNKSVCDSYTKYELIVSFPEDIRNNNYLIFNDRTFCVYE